MNEKLALEHHIATADSKLLISQKSPVQRLIARDFKFNHLIYVINSPSRNISESPKYSAIICKK